MADAPELVLREALAALLHTWGLGTYTGPTAPLVEGGVKVDGDRPTTVDKFVMLTSPPTVRDGGRVNRIHRVQFYRREKAARSTLEQWADGLALHLDHKEYLPNVLGISWAWETTRMFFDPDTQKRSAVAVTYAFRGRR